GTLYWYPLGSGGTGSTTASVVNTSVPGTTNVWVAQRIGGCESPRATFQVKVITTPPVPLVTGPVDYCQFIGPFHSMTVATTTSGNPRWYNTATGGTGSPTEPPV